MEIDGFVIETPTTSPGKQTAVVAVLCSQTFSFFSNRLFYTLHPLFSNIQLIHLFPSCYCVLVESGPTSPSIQNEKLQIQNDEMAL